MNFKEIIDVTKNIIDETDEDEQIDVIVKDAINKAYLDLSNLDYRVTRAYIPIINKIATIPNNCTKIIECYPPLNPNEKIYGRSLITNREGVIEMIYAYTREPLVEDEDEPDLNTTLQYALVTYACYRYFEHRKKIEVANSFLNNYNQQIDSFNNNLDTAPETITEVGDYYYGTNV